MITQNYVVVSPAYGKDYKSARDASAAFLSGVDFKVESLGSGGTYCSVRDFACGITVNVRYNRLQRVAPTVVVKDHLCKASQSGVIQKLNPTPAPSEGKV